MGKRESEFFIRRRVKARKKEQAAGGKKQSVFHLFLLAIDFFDINR
jgi:hypothetical protein